MQATDPTARPNHAALRVALIALALPLLVACIALWWWDREPTIVNPSVPPRTEQVAMRRPMTPGAATTISVIRAVQSLAGRHSHPARGHHHPQGAAMEETPGWERGSLLASRDLLHALREDFARPKAPLLEDQDLATADTLLAGHAARLPPRSAENQYRKVADRLLDYLDRLTDDDPDNAHFYISAPGLADYLEVVSDRLDALQERLAAGMIPPHPGEFTPPRWPIVASALVLRRGGLPWRHTDETLYETRGYTATLLAQMKAFQHDFGPVLKSDQAKADLRQAIEELEAMQSGPANPLALDGAPMVHLPEHALALAAAVERIDDAVFDLCEELRKS